MLKIFRHYKHYHVFAVLVLPNGDRLNSETTASTDAPYLNRGWLADKLRDELRLGPDIKIIFTNVIPISKTQASWWTKELK